MSLGTGFSTYVEVRVFCSVRGGGIRAFSPQICYQSAECNASNGLWATMAVTGMVGLADNDIQLTHEHDMPRRQGTRSRTELNLAACTDKTGSTCSSAACACHRAVPQMQCRLYHCCIGIRLVLVHCVDRFKICNQTSLSVKWWAKRAEQH